MTDGRKDERTGRRRGWAGRLVAGGLVLAGAALVAGVAMMPAQKKNLPPTEAELVNVEVEVVHVWPVFEETFDLHGVVAPLRVVRVAAEVAGQVEAYGRRTGDVTWRGRVFRAGEALDEGQPVQAGDVLMRLDREILQAERDRAQAQFDYDRSEHQRLLALRERNAAGVLEVESTATRLAVSQATLKMAQEQLDRTTILAPIAGVLNRLPVEEGEYVQPGQPVAEIVDLKQVKVTVDVPERDVGHLSVGQEERIFHGPKRDDEDSAQGRGRITYISELADPATRSSRVEITVDNPDEALRPGQIVAVRLTRGRPTDVILIPLEAVMPLENGKEVYVVADGKAEPRRVELGFFRDYRVSVMGLKEGEELIVKGHRFVSPGQPVRVQKRSIGGPATASAPAGTAAAPSQERT